MPRFPEGSNIKGGQASVQVHRKMAEDFYRPVIPIVRELHARGLSLRQIGKELERQGIKARWGWVRWAPAQVRRVLLRAGREGVNFVNLPQQAPAVAEGPDLYPSAVVG